MLEDALNAFPGTIVLITHDRYLIRSVANAIIEVNAGEATLYPGDFEYYAAKRGLDIETRGAVEGIATPRGIEAVPARPRESAVEAAARKRAEAEARNRRYRRTRDLRDALERIETEVRETDASLAEMSERLADPATYADHHAFRELIERHNAARDRADQLAAEWARLSAELEAAEAEDSLTPTRPMTRRPSPNLARRAADRDRRLVASASLGPIARYADAAGVSSLTLVTWRAGVGAIVVLVFVAVRAAGGTTACGARGASCRVAIGSSCSLAAPTNAALNLGMFVAFLRIGIALALLIFYVYPAFVALASVAWFGERLDRLRWAALGISMAGVVLVVAGAGDLGSLDALGIGLAFVGALAQTFYALAAHHGFRAVPGTQAAAVTMGGAALVYLVVALADRPAARRWRSRSPASAALWPVLVAGVAGRRPGDRLLHRRHPAAGRAARHDPLDPRAGGRAWRWRPSCSAPCRRRSSSSAAR